MHNDQNLLGAGSSCTTSDDMSLADAPAGLVATHMYAPVSAYPIFATIKAVPLPTTVYLPPKSPLLADPITPAAVINEEIVFESEFEDRGVDILSGSSFLSHCTEGAGTPVT